MCTIRLWPERSGRLHQLRRITHIETSPHSGFRSNLHQRRRKISEVCPVWRCEPGASARRGLLRPRVCEPCPRTCRARRLLSGTPRTKPILKPRGKFRLVVPDLKKVATDYLAANETGSSCASHDFMRNSYFGTTARQRSLIGRLSASLGNSDHLWMGDAPSMMMRLRKWGLKGSEWQNFAILLIPPLPWLKMNLNLQERSPSRPRSQDRIHPYPPLPDRRTRAGLRYRRSFFRLKSIRPL